MSLSDVILRMNPQTLTVTRTIPPRIFGVESGGIAGEPTVTAFTIVAAHQPFTGKTLNTAPEGRSSSETRKLWTATQLNTEVEGVQEADVVTIDGKQYEVTSCEHWPMGDFYVATLEALS